MTPITLLHIFPTFAVGGAQARFATLANQLGDEARHIIVSLDGRTNAREKLDPAIKADFPPAPPPGLRGALAFLRATRRDGAADRLVTSNWGSMDWAIANRATRLPHLHTEDGFGPEEQDRQLARRAWTRRLVLRHSDVALPSQTLLRIAQDQWRLPKARLHLIPNGIDTARFAAAAPIDDPRLAALGPGPVIGTIAALRPEKNLARLLEAFALLRARRPARLVIVGEGAERAALQAKAEALGIAGAVLFAGHSAAPERWMAAFDVFALSSDTEQMPLSVLEAMAAGLPVAATDVGDVRLMVAEANIPFIVPRDAAALANALANATTSTAGAANQSKARAVYDQETMVARYRKLFTVKGKAGGTEPVPPDPPSIFGPGSNFDGGSGGGGAPPPVLPSMRLLALALLTPLAAHAQRPGNEIGTGSSLPRSDNAGNLNAATTQSELAPNLPPPQSDEIGPLLAEARADLQANRTGAAQEALERAETRALDRSIPAGTERIPADSALVAATGQARAALAAGDVRGAIAIINRALPWGDHGR